ncbi:Sec23-binding domain of Sec16-domain-containing protein [Neohortaea acidophila]|uniref:Protein transport protein sec16 n=1 Tax=Neohortaea acidophila TaxID=245834 RepID=A0A6A6PGN9_9PEZI|nr:Sec23-binding domain of Sec16-domain-containing protein [Neohortaea acidophila]KAF2478894.1 Sec23-binding domain of Sec16-domain-containing protein [Neohortaea acidophila]
MDNDTSEPANVFTSHSAGAAAASWHPAFRNNSDAVPEEEDDFFARYPGPTPKKNDVSDATDNHKLFEPESPSRERSSSIVHNIETDDSQTAPEEIQQVSEADVGLDGHSNSELNNGVEQEAWAQDIETPILSHQDSVEEQEQALEEHLPDDPVLDVESAQPAEGAEYEDEEAPAEHYEHQGEGTEMEEGTEPSAAESLLENEQPMPTAQPLDQVQQEPPRPHLDRSFTTNFSDSPVEAVQPRSMPDEWPSVGDDKTFGELLDHESSTVHGHGHGHDHEALEAAAAEESEGIAAPDANPSPEETTNQLLEGTAAEEAQTLSAPDADPLLEDGPGEEDLAAAWGAALDDDDMLVEDSGGLDPSSFFGEDDDGFLDDEPFLEQSPAAQQKPATAQQAAPHTSPGMPSPQFFNPTGHGRSAGTPSTGLYDVYNHSATQPQAPQQRPPALQQAQSFSDKSKGGYQSPYDLPMEVVKPRRRPQASQQPTPLQTSPAIPPPRSSSFGSPSVPPQGPGSNLSPPPSRDSTSSKGIAPAKSTPKTASGFFEELPVTAKPRNRPAGTPQPMPTPPLQAGLRSPPRGLPPQQQAYSATSAVSTPPASQQSSVYGGLRQPERMPLIPDQPVQQQQPVQAPAPNTRYSPSAQQAGGHAPSMPPASQSRYSPAPAAAANTSHPPAAAARYSPAPASQPMQAMMRQTSGPIAPPAQQANLFAPRTSSPLAAFTDKPHAAVPSEPPAPRNVMPSSSPKAYGLQRGITDTRYSPAKSNEIPPQIGVPLQQRPQTQSPDQTMKQARMTRPASGGAPLTSMPTGPVLPHRRRFSREYLLTPPQDDRAQDPLERWKGYPIFNWSPGGTIVSSMPKHTPFYAAGSGVPTAKRTPGPVITQDAEQLLPMNERNAKFPGPLAAKSKGRKKDVVAWMGGKIQDLEQQTQAATMDFSLSPDLKKRAEEKLVLWKMMRLFVEHDGVLDGNAKVVEEVRAILLPNLAQLAQISELQSPGSAVVERDAVDKHVTLQLRQALLEGNRERAVWLAEDKRLWGHAMLIASTMGPDTWKQIVQAFVRNQVKSFGSDARSLAALYQVFANNSEECVDELVPPSARAGFQMISMADGSVAGNPLEGLDQWRETLGLVTSNRTTNDAQSLISLGKLLAGYGRVEAAHTCYLFARTFVKHSGPDDADAHFVLLGANHQAKDETFGNDLDAILLTEIYEYATSLSAASTSPPYVPHLQAFKLVHAQELAAYGLKSKAQTYCDAITSAYTSTTRPSPYYHPTFTQAVADLGAFLSQTPHDGKSGFLSRPALNKVSSSATSWFTKFVAGEDDQTPGGAAPSGATGEAGPFGGVNGDSGTISRTGSSSELYNPMMAAMSSPPPVQPMPPTSMPSRYTPGAPVTMAKPAAAPQYSSLGTSAAESSRPSSSRYAPASAVGSNLGLPGQTLSKKTSNYSLPQAAGSRRGSGQDNSSQGSYEPRPLLAEDSASPYGYSPQVQYPPDPSPAVSSPLVLGEVPVSAQHAEDAIPDFNGMPGPAASDEPATGEGFSSSYEPPTGGSGGYEPPTEGTGVYEPPTESSGVYEPPTESSGGYEPPTGGYEPPTYAYEPYEPDADSPEDVASPKKKQTFGDEDDNDGGESEVERRAAALKKSQADKAADEAFRKAAEADAARDKAGSGGQKKGWFGGWFAGGAKDGTLSPGPIKAKLGEENSFYFDKDLGKWVNKKGGADSASASAAPTPPPPRGPPSRVASFGMQARPSSSGPPSRTSSGVALAGMSSGARPPTSGSGPGFSAPPSGPASRSATPASDAAPPLPLPLGLNGDLAPPKRPASGLSDASSIDDLLGGPAGSSRKAGTVKAKKKGGRYVDVMAAK